MNPKHDFKQSLQEKKEQSPPPPPQRQQESPNKANESKEKKEIKFYMTPDIRNNKRKQSTQYLQPKRSNQDGEDNMNFQNDQDSDKSIDISLLDAEQSHKQSLITESPNHDSDDEKKEEVKNLKRREEVEQQQQEEKGQKRKDMMNLSQQSQQVINQDEDQSPLKKKQSLYPGRFNRRQIDESNVYAIAPNYKNNNIKAQYQQDYQNRRGGIPPRNNRQQQHKYLPQFEPKQFIQLQSYTHLPFLANHDLYKNVNYEQRTIILQIDPGYKRAKRILLNKNEQMQLICKKPNIFMCTLPVQELKCQFTFVINKGGQTYTPYQQGIITNPELLIISKYAREFQYDRIQINSIPPHDKFFTASLRAQSFCEDNFLSCLTAHCLNQNASHFISTNPQKRTLFETIFGACPKKSKGKDPYMATLAQVKIFMLLGAIGRENRFYFTKNQAKLFRKNVFHPLCTKNVAEEIRQQRLLNKVELSLLKDGVLYINYKFRFEYDSVKLIELTRCVKVQNLRFNELPRSEKSYQEIQLLEFDTLPNYAKNNLFLQLYVNEPFKQQYFESLISLIKPTPECFNQLKQEDQILVRGIQESYKMLVGASQIQQTTSKKQFYIPPHQRQAQDFNFKKFQLYVYFSEFDNSDQLHFSLRDQNIKFTRVKNSKVFYHVFEFLNDADQILYRLILTRNKVKYTSKLRKLANMKNNSVYFICQKKFLAPNIRHIQSFAHYPHDNFFRFYLSQADILPQEFFRQLVAFYKKNQMALPQLRNFQEFAINQSNYVKVFCYASTFLVVFDQILFKGVWLQRLVEFDKKKLSSLNEQQKEQLAQYFNTLCATMSFDLRIKLNKLKSYLPKLKIKWNGLHVTSVNEIKRAMTDFKVSDFTLEQRSYMMQSLVHDLGSFQVLAYVIDILKVDSQLQSKVLYRFIYNYFGMVDQRDLEQGFLKIDSKKLSLCLTYPHFRRCFEDCHSHIVLTMLPKLIKQFPEQYYQRYYYDLVKLVHRWSKHVQTIFKQQQYIDWIPNLFDFLKYFLNKNNIPQVVKIVKNTIEFIVLHFGIDFLALIANRKVQYKFCQGAIELCYEKNFNVFFESMEIATRFLANLELVIKRINISNTIGNYFQKLYNYYRIQKQLNPFDIVSKPLILKCINVMKSLSIINMAENLITAANQILKEIQSENITGGRFFEIIKRHENAILEFMRLFKKTELQKKDYLNIKIRFLATHDSITSIMYYFSEFNYKIDAVDNQEFRKLQKLKEEMDQMPLSMILKNQDWIKQFNYLKSWEFLYRFKDNELVRNLLESEIEPLQFQSFQALDTEIYDNFIMKTLRNMSMKIQQYFESTGNQLRVQDATKIQKITNRQNFSKQMEEIVKYYAQDSLSSKNFKTLVQHLEKFFDIMPQLHQMKSFLEAANVIGLIMQDDQQLVKMNESITKIYKFLDQNGQLNEVSKVTPEISKFFQNLFRKTDKIDRDRFREFVTTISRSGELIAFLRQYEDFNFQDLIDVIDDTAFEADAFLRDVILVKQLFTEMWEAINEKDQDGGISQMKAAFQIWSNNPRQDLSKIVQDCCSNVRQIEQKIEEQLDRSGQTQEILKMLYHFSFLTFKVKEKKILISLMTRAIQDKNDDKIKQIKKQYLKERPNSLMIHKKKTALKGQGDQVGQEDYKQWQDADQTGKEDQKGKQQEEDEKKQKQGDQNVQINDQQQKKKVPVNKNPKAKQVPFKTLEFQQFSQIIARCNMYNVQYSNEQGEQTKNQQQRKRIHMSKILFYNYNIALKIKNHLRNMLQYGYIFIPQQTQIIGTAQQVQNQLIIIQLDAKKDLEEWKTQYFKARLQYKSLYFVSPSILKHLHQSFHCHQGQANTKHIPILAQAIEFVTQKDRRNQIKKTINEEKINAPKRNNKNLDQILKHLGKVFNVLISPPKVKDLAMNAIQDKICSGRKFALRRIQNEQECWGEIYYVFACHQQAPSATQVLFCQQDSQFQVLEQFVYRAYDLQACYHEKQPIYMMIGFQKLPLLMQIKIMDVIQKVYDQMSHDKILNLVIMYTAQHDHNAHVLEELKVAKQSNLPVDFILDNALRNNNLDINIITSEFAGLGKSFMIQQRCTIQNIKLIRCPCYGQMKKSQIIDLLNKYLSKAIVQRAGGVARAAIHFDLYHMNDLSIHYLLFQILVLNKFHNKFEQFCVLPKNTLVFVEIANTFNNKLVRQLDYLKYFRFTSIKSIQQANINFESNKTLLGYSLRYLDCLDRNKLATQVPVANNKVPDNARGQFLINKYFLNGLKNANFYQLQTFISFLGRQVYLMENSIYMNIETMKWSQLDPGIRTNIVQDLAKLSKNFACQVHINQANYKESQELLVKQMAQNVGLWQDYDGFLLAFNADGGSIMPFYKKLDTVPLKFRQFLRDMNKLLKTHEQADLLDFDKYSESFLQNILLNLCVKHTAQKNQIRQNIDNLFSHVVLTKDNVIKIAIIFLRIMAKIPVIIMGETGVGKTILIQYLSELISGQIETLNVHAGLTQQGIKDWVINVLLTHGYDMENQIYRNNFNVEEWENSNKVILFFDEINTNINVGGILKEILVDHRLLGMPLPINVVPIGAANPYKLRKSKNDNFTQGLKIEGLKSSKLVYLVHPLPESMLTFVWDFGVLKMQDQLKYIEKIVANTVKNIPVLNQKVHEMARCVQYCQRFARDNQALWAVSLRDLRRWSKVVRFFINQNWGFNESFSLSIFYCYYCRFDRYELRTQFQEDIIAQFPLVRAFKDHKKLALNSFGDTFEEEPGIAMNLPLKENTFLIMVSIINNIPIILTGPPGSSKTLSTNLVYKNMKGPESRHKFWRNKPKLIYKSYQCSQLSTSHGIQRCFELAQKVNIQYKDRNRITVILLDEIGLAQKSPSNPLKVLHSLLETSNIPVVGLSNWQLDAAKMNRFVHASRPSLHLNDLKDTVRSLKKAINRHTDVILLDRLAEDFDQYTYSSNQLTFFHGTRDFYQLVSFICRYFDKYENNTQRLLMQGIQRNFGGKRQKNGAFKIFKRALFGIDPENYVIPQTVLIKNNLIDSMSRHLMIITQNPENAISCLEGIANQANAKMKVFYGSDFKQDTTQKSAYDIINQIVLCMEQGQILVMLNLDFLYQSFYDLLNQNYTIIRGKRFCRIAIGSDSYRYQVHKNFKAVVIASETDVYDRHKYDPAFLNRFEKQLFNFADLFTVDERQLITEVQDWLKEVSQVRDFGVIDMVPIYTQDILESLIFKNRYKDDAINKCKNDLIKLMSVSGVIRSKNDDITHKYWGEQRHKCLLDFLEYAGDQVEMFKNQEGEYDEFSVQNKGDLEDGIDLQQSKVHNKKIEKLLTRAQGPSIRWVDNHGFKIIMYTTSLLNFQRDLNQDGRKYKYNFMKIQVSAIDSEALFTQMLTEYFETPEVNLLIIVTNVLYDCRQRILLVKSKVQQIRSKFIEKQKFQSPDALFEKSVLFVIRTVNKSWPGLSIDESWNHILLENLSKNDPDVSPLQCLDVMMNPLQNILENEKIFTEIFNLALPKAISLIKFQAKENKQQMVQRFKKYRQLFFQQKDENTDLVIRKMIKLLEPRRKPWFQQIAFNRLYNSMNNTFLKVLQQILVEKLTKQLATLFFIAEKGGLMSQQNIKEFKPEIRETFIQMWHKEYSEAVVQRMVIEQAHRVKLPYSNIIAQRFLGLKDIFQKQFKGQQLTNQVLKGFNDIAQQSIEKPVHDLINIRYDKYIYSITLFDGYKWCEQSYILKTLNQIIQYFDQSVQTISSVNLLIWIFQDFLKDLIPIYKKLKEEGLLIQGEAEFEVVLQQFQPIQGKKDVNLFAKQQQKKKQEEQFQGIDDDIQKAILMAEKQKRHFTTQNKIKAAILNNVLNIILENYIYKPRDELRGLIYQFVRSLLYEILDLQRKYSDVLINQDALSKLKFYCKINKIIGINTQTQKFFTSLKNQSLSSVFENNDKFTDVLSKFSKNCPIEKEGALQLELYKIAIISQNSNAELIVRVCQMINFESQRIINQPDQYILSKQIIYSILDPIKLYKFNQIPNKNDQIVELTKVLRSQDQFSFDNSFYIFLTDIIEQKFYSNYNNQFSEQRVNQAFEGVTNQKKPLLLRAFDMAYLRYIIKDISYYIQHTSMKLKIQKDVQNLSRKHLELFNKHCSKFRGQQLFVVYLTRLIKSNPKFNTPLERLKNQIKAFDDPKLFLQEKVKEDTMPWEGDIGFQDAHIGLKRVYQNNDCKFLKQLKKSTRLQIIVLGMLIEKLQQQQRQQQYKIDQPTIKDMLQSIQAPNYSHNHIQIVLNKNKRPKSLTKLLKQKCNFVIGAELCMIGMLLENNQSFVYQLINDQSQKKQGIGETFLPFMADSDFNNLIDAAFLKQQKLTRYLCNKCQKFYLFIGQCGNINHGQFQQKCSQCGQNIGSKGYNQPIGLKRCDPTPVHGVNRQNLYVCLPGYQESRPQQNQKIRGFAGLSMHIGRFYSLSCIYYLSEYLGYQLKGNQDNIDSKDAVLHDLQFEWMKIGQLSGKKSESQVLMLIYTFIINLIDTNQNNTRFNRVSLTAKNKHDRKRCQGIRKEFQQILTS